MFMGEYHHTIDEKGRITIPSKIREILGNDAVVTRGLDKCLFIYRLDDFKELINKYKELPNTKDTRNYMRFFLSGAMPLSFDKQGRINIEKNLMEFAKLKKDCVIIGVIDRLEIWDKGEWNEFVRINEENLSEIADNLFTSNI